MHIRVLPEQWDRIERAGQGSDLTSSQLITELAIEALDRREWTRSEAETRLARASLFNAQVLARDLIAAGRDKEVEEMREFISTIVPDPDAHTGKPFRNLCDNRPAATSFWTYIPHSPVVHSLQLDRRDCS